MPDGSAGTRPGPPQVVVGAVSFLNAKPLVAGLRDDRRVRVVYGVPSELAGWVRDGRVDAALVPVVDLAGRPGLAPVSDACIASDGETLTVRVFSRVPPSRVQRLRVDGDSHTSVALAKLVWADLFGHAPATIPLESSVEPVGEDGVLLIGDKVVAARPRGFAFEVDLGGVWRERTGLPFVYAVWATPPGADHRELAERLSRSRDLGVERASQIAEVDGPVAGWPVEIARQYLTEYMHYRMTDRHREGMALFLRKLAEQDISAPPDEGLAKEGAA